MSALRPWSRREVLFASTAALGAGLLTACGRGSDGASTGGGGPTASAGVVVDDAPATGVVTLWAPDGDATALEKTLADFRAANPELDLQVTLVPSDEYNTKLQTAVASGTAPDIAQVYTESQAQFLATGAFAAVPDGLLDSSVFFPGVWQAGAYEGVQYSVPWYAYTYALIYRKDLAAAGGAQVPTRWEESAPFYKALEAGGAQKGLGGNVGWDTYSGQDLFRLVHQTGHELLSADGTTWQLDAPEVVEAIAYASQPFLDGTAAVDSPGFLDSQPYFVQGKTGSMISGPWVIAALDGVAQEPGWTQAHVATARPPKGPANATGNLGGGSWVVSKDSANAASAWKAVREMADPTVQIAQFSAYGSMPAVPAAWKDPAIAGNPLYEAFLQQLADVAPQPPVSTWAQVSTAMGKELEAVARGTSSPQQAATAMQTAATSAGTGR